MQAHVGIAHIALDLRLGHKGGYGVDHDHIQRAGAGEVFGDLKRLLAVIRLGDQKGIHVHAQVGGVNGIQRVLRVDKRGLAAVLLCLGHNVQGKGGFTGAFGAVDLNDPALGQAADAGGDIQRDAAGGNGVHVESGGLPQTHHGALSEDLFDLCDGCFQRLLLI